MVVRTVTYFGFELERELAPLPSPFPADLADPARDALAEALLAGITPHPDQAAVRHALQRLGFYWRRSGGTLAAAASERSQRRMRGQLEGVNSWSDFVDRRLHLGVEEVVPADERARLEALPASLHLFGDRIAIEYEVERTGGAARLRLREGQARRLRPADLPSLDRPVRFTVVRGKREALRAESLQELQRMLRTVPHAERRGRGATQRRRRR